MISSKGEIIHIDFGFILGDSPGNINFESAPFKMTKEYLEMLEGEDSDYFAYFEMLMFRGFLALRKYHEDFRSLIELISYKS